MLRTLTCFTVFLIATVAFVSADRAAEPVRLIFDTDMSGDDVVALAVIHALQNRNECELLGITITMDNQNAASMAQAVNTFYGRPDIPIAVVKDGAGKGGKKFHQQVLDLKDENEEFIYLKERSTKIYPDAVTFLRRCLAAQPDGSVVIVQVGFFTNLARLLASEGDEITPLNGKELVEKKVKFCSIMAGDFAGKTLKETNVVMDIPSAQQFIRDCPTKIFFSGYEIGRKVSVRTEDVLGNFNYAKNHIVKEVYRFYYPTNAPQYDQASVLYAIRPEHKYFDISEPGHASFSDDGLTAFSTNLTGKHYFLRANESQITKVIEALALLNSEPPLCRTITITLNIIRSRMPTVFITAV